MDIGILLIITVFSTLFSLPLLCWFKHEITKIEWDRLGKTALGKKFVSAKENLEKIFAEKMQKFTKQEDTTT